MFEINFSTLISSEQKCYNEYIYAKVFVDFVANVIDLIRRVLRILIFQA